jgi:hypothetical protein
MMKSSLEKQGKQLQERNKRFSAAGGGAAVAAPVGGVELSAAVEVATVASRPAAEKAKRPRCLLRVRKSGDGVTIWYAGAEFQQSQ